MKNNYFKLNNEKHYVNTIVSIYRDKVKDFNFNIELKFVGVDEDTDELHFWSQCKGDNKCYKMKRNEVEKYIEKIVSHKNPPLAKPKPQDKRGFGTALIWVLAICFMSMFINGGFMAIIATVLCFLWWLYK